MPAPAKTRDSTFCFPLVQMKGNEKAMTRRAVEITTLHDNSWTHLFRSSLCLPVIRFSPRTFTTQVWDGWYWHHVLAIHILTRRTEHQRGEDQATAAKAWTVCTVVKRGWNLDDFHVHWEIFHMWEMTNTWSEIHLGYRNDNRLDLRVST